MVCIAEPLPQICGGSSTIGRLEGERGPQVSASAQWAVYVVRRGCWTPYIGLTKGRRLVWLADGSHPSWSLLAECGCPRGAAPERVARRAGRGGGRRGALTFRPSRSRVWRPLTGENGVGGKLVRVC